MRKTEPLDPPERRLEEFARAAASPALADHGWAPRARRCRPRSGDAGEARASRWFENMSVGAPRQALVDRTWRDAP